MPTLQAINYRQPLSSYITLQKSSPDLISSGSTDSGEAPKSPIQLKALGKSNFTDNAVVDQRQQPNTLSLAIVVRRPMVIERRQSSLMGNSGGDIDYCKAYLKAGYCAAAIASRFMECGSYIQAMLSVSSYIEDARTLALENKLSELAFLEDQTQARIEAIWDKKLGDLRRFVIGDTLEIRPNNNCSGESKHDSNIDLRLGYSWTFLQRFFDMRIKLAQMDLELGSTALRLAVDNVYYASDCKLDGRMFKPVCDTDIDLFDFMALGDVHEDDVIMRKRVVDQNSEFLQSFDSSLSSPSRYSAANKLMPPFKVSH